MRNGWQGVEETERVNVLFWKLREVCVFIFWNQEYGISRWLRRRGRC